jgi:competence protein CoiA
MLSARRKVDGQTVLAYDERKENGPFCCLECGDPVILKTGRNRINHFAHEFPLARHYAENESDDHRRCKLEIYQALLRHPNATHVALERQLGEVRPDVSARINGVPVAIEVQISNLSVETIRQRTIEYFRKGIAVLWLLQWTPDLDAPRYTPRDWEKWVHACYFGRVYYWLKELDVVAYHFEASLKSVPKRTWHDRRGRMHTAGGYTKHLKRTRSTVRGETFNLATDFAPQQRYWWEGNGVKVPDAKLFMAPSKADYKNNGRLY